MYILIIKLYLRILNCFAFFRRVKHIDVRFLKIQFITDKTHYESAIFVIDIDLYHLYFCKIS